MGCLLVPVGHPNSDEKDLQWRSSFSKQERLLVHQFNSTQVYILLKLVKKGDITTCKTCILKIHQVHFGNRKIYWPV